jgi:hypothetical protein
MPKYCLKIHHTGILEKRSAGMKFRNQKKFRYGIVAYTGPFQPLVVTIFITILFSALMKKKLRIIIFSS